MAGWNEEMLLALAPTPWQPLSARKTKPDPLPTRWRLGVLALVALLHVLALIGLLALLKQRERAPDDAILVDFIDVAPSLPTPAPNETITIHMPKPVPKAPRREPAKPAVRLPPIATVEVPMQALDLPSAPPKHLQLYNPDGSLRLPEDMLDKLDQKFGDKRVFSWQIPHMDDAKKYFARNPALPYEPTRFDKYYTPDTDALTALLTKAVQATTKQIKVKVPGTSGSYMVCTISILALGGGCGVLTNGADWNGPQDDPNTLNPQEDRQCQAWWQKIVDAKTQDAWRATRDLYDHECLKPKLRPAAG
jgi:hypothetical protein